MAPSVIRVLAAALGTVGVLTFGANARQAPPAPPPGATNDPFPNPFPATAGAIRVNVAEFASLPDIDGTGPHDNMVNELDAPCS